MEKYTMFMDQKNQYYQNSILPKAICRFNAIPIKLPKVFFHRSRTNNFTICMEIEKTSNSQSNLEKEEQNWRNQPASLQALLQSHSHQTVWYWHKDRNIDQWNRIESPEINPRTYGHLIFNKGGKNIQWKKDNLFNKWCWENLSTACKRMKLEHSNTIHKNKLKMD